MFRKLQILALALAIPGICRSDDTSHDLPFFAGTLLAFFPENVAPGELVIQPYLYMTTIAGNYGRHWSFQKTKPIHELGSSVLFETGITDRIDISLMINGTYNQYGRFHSLLYQDMQAYLGLQILTDNPKSWTPDLRFVAGEGFPTGQYQTLNPKKNFSNASGTGSYETFLVLVTRKIFHPFGKHPFNVNLNFGYTLFTKTKIKGYNFYGGDSATVGTISPGNQYFVNVAFEVCLTRNWVLGSDIHMLHQNRSLFQGTPGNSSLASGVPSWVQISLAPCLEYNFNENFGGVAGCWFTIAGKNANKFVSNQISIFYTF